MISEELLRRAAARSCACYAAVLVQGFDPAEAHAFSPAFEQRMVRLCRRAEHPALYTGLQRAAAILLAALIAGTAWLAVDVNARERFAGWLREVRGISIHFETPENVDVVLDPGDCRPRWLPEGYAVVMERDTGSRISIIYKNQTGDQIHFRCVYRIGTSTMMIDTTGCTAYDDIVAGFDATLVLGNDSSVSSGVVWTDDDGRLFEIAGFPSREDLLKVAESIYEK